ncbi:MAG: alkaline phosphatase D family protein [Saprospiraceae bacterium]
MNTPKIVLGPLLGVESDSDYTICILINHKDLPEINEIHLSVNHKIYHSIQSETILDKYTFLRFEFNFSRPEYDGKIITYYFTYKNEKLVSAFNERIFDIYISAITRDKGVALVSCSGSHSASPSKLLPEDFGGWKKIIYKRPDLLILAGDQVYAETIWNSLPEVKKILKSKKKNVTPQIEKQICEFYCELYIESWKQCDIGLTLATIPNIMTWDDHDIIDGYGSLPDHYQNSQLLDFIFKTAKKYYGLFQIRGENKTLINPGYDFSAILSWRNYKFVIPDTRSHRNKNQIIHQQQYDLIENVFLKKNSFVAEKNTVLAFVLPVPIAHRKYSIWLEKQADKVFYAVEKIWSGVIKYSLDDDLLDHWEHHEHEQEQKYMLNMIFKIGNHLKPKNLIVLSGDVHFSGASKIEKSANQIVRTATQIISSPIVNKPFSARIGNFLAKYSTDTNQIGDCTISDFKDFGDYKNKMFTRRNFIIIKKRSDNNSLNCAMYYEPWESKPFFRNVNKFR